MMSARDIGETPAYACGFAENLVEKSLRYLRDLPVPDDAVAAIKLIWAIDALNDALKALQVPFERKEP